MKTFRKWAEDHGLNEILEHDPKPTKNENRKRTGYSVLYPSGYFANQYPDGYVRPSKATAALDQDNIAKNNIH